MFRKVTSQFHALTRPGLSVSEPARNHCCRWAGLLSALLLALSIWLLHAGLSPWQTTAFETVLPPATPQKHVTQPVEPAVEPALEPAPVRQAADIETIENLRAELAAAKMELEVEKATQQQLERQLAEQGEVLSQTREELEFLRNAKD